MKIASLLYTVAAMAFLDAGCDNQHLLGAFDDGGGQPDGGQLPYADGAVDGGVLLEGGTRPFVDGGYDRPEIGVLGPSESWTGYIENYQFPSGSDVVKITFASDPAGQLVGRVTLGSGTPPPPATDPNVGYPADIAGQGAVVLGPNRYVAEGFGYSMRDGTISGRRLRFSVALSELWTGWCALQTPVPPQGDCDEPVCKSLCLPNWGSMVSGDGMHCAQLNPATNQYVAVDCGKLALCVQSMTCLCDASACAVYDRGVDMSFDVAITGNLADGSVTSGHNVHFTKDP